MFGEELCSGSGLRFCECAGNSGTTQTAPNFATNSRDGRRFLARLAKIRLLCVRFFLSNYTLFASCVRCKLYFTIYHIEFCGHWKLRSAVDRCTFGRNPGEFAISRNLRYPLYSFLRRARGVFMAERSECAVAPRDSIRIYRSIFAFIMAFFFLCRRSVTVAPGAIGYRGDVNV